MSVSGPEWADLVAEWVDVDEWHPAPGYVMESLTDLDGVTVKDAKSQAQEMYLLEKLASNVQWAWCCRDWVVICTPKSYLGAIQIVYTGGWAISMIYIKSLNQLPRAFRELYTEPDFTGGSYVERPDGPDDPSDYGL